MKILFIDFDGVLNNKASWFKAGQIEKYDDPSDYLVEDLVTKLNPIVEQSGCNIVISSSWRNDHPLSEIKKFLTKKGFLYAAKIIDVTKNISPRNRENEVHEWLTRHANVKKFAIIDDVEFFFPEVFPRQFVKTDYTYGLTDENVNSVIEILKD
jgi:hypothetical protein